MATPIIEIDQLVKRYGDRVAVNGVTFSVLEGEIFGLLGPNGAGKSTTISMLATFFLPDGGRALVGGHDVTREPQEVQRLVGFVPQDLALYPTLSAWDNLFFFGEIYGLNAAVLKQRIAEVLALVGLSDRARDAVKTFSGGMKRRLNIAAGLIHRPRILFLDEPTVGVDPQSRNFIFEHVERLNGEGMTIVYTSHYMEEVERLCDRVAIMDQGNLLALDTTRGLIGLLGGGVIYLGLPAEMLRVMLPAIDGLAHVTRVAEQDDHLKVETS